MKGVEEWSQVTYVRKSKKKGATRTPNHGKYSNLKSRVQTLAPEIDEALQASLETEEVNSITSVIHHHLRSTFPQTTYFHYYIDKIVASLQKDEWNRIVMLGIGSFRRVYSNSALSEIANNSSFWQLLLALYLQSYLKGNVVKQSVGDGSVMEGLKETASFSYDPLLLNDFDRPIYTSLGIQLLDRVEKTALLSFQTLLYPADKSKIIFYMPHCPYRLYCNILYSYWDCLNSIIIVGNSFHSYSVRRMTSQHAIDPTDTVALLTPFVEEISICSLKLPSRKKHQRSEELNRFVEEYDHIIQSAFSDLSIQYFPAEQFKDPQSSICRLLSEKKPTIEQMIEANVSDIELF
eukprot:gene4788-5140_t